MQFMVLSPYLNLSVFRRLSRLYLVAYLVVYLVVYRLVYSVVYPIVHPVFIPSFVSSFVPSFIPSFILSSTHTLYSDSLPSLCCYLRHSLRCYIISICSCLHMIRRISCRSFTNHVISLCSSPTPTSVVVCVMSSRFPPPGYPDSSDAHHVVSRLDPRLFLPSLVAHSFSHCGLFSPSRLLFGYSSYFTAFVTVSSLSLRC
jgi:hypothetical protein